MKYESVFACLLIAAIAFFIGAFTGRASAPAPEPPKVEVVDPGYKIGDRLYVEAGFMVHAGTVLCVGKEYLVFKFDGMRGAMGAISFDRVIGRIE
jgi:hypothetical protein